MSEELKVLIEKSRQLVMSAPEREQQRRSFAYGNTRIENPRITRQTVDRIADAQRDHRPAKEE